MQGYFRDKTVLDIGCASGWRRDDWFHGFIRSVAREAVGIDIDQEALDGIARRGGYDVTFGDASDFDLGRTFDVVHAGELIEHTDDPHGLLVSVRRHLRGDSLFVLTTPNAFRITNFVYRVGGKAQTHRDHVSWYCEDTLRQLLERNEFEVVEVGYLRHESVGRWRTVASSSIRALLPSHLAWNTLYATARRRDG
jgi:2-polyprenyl-3-methyl-5-hydroxy-6-metoxy-1,4-benzoquinol methylase